MSEHIVTPEWIAIQRSWCAIGVATPASMLHALDEVERLTAAVERVRELHTLNRYGICKDCGTHKCNTLRALEATP